MLLSYVNVILKFPVIFKIGRSKSAFATGQLFENIDRTDLAVQVITICTSKISVVLGSLACVASVPVRSERNSGRAKESFGPREK